jgi:hypothetical protein
MNDWQRETKADYQRKGFASRSGYGRSPAFVVVDFINGFTDPSTPLGGDFAWEINATRQLQQGQATDFLHHDRLRRGYARRGRVR